MTNTKIKFICVMDYRTCEVRFYNVEVDAKDFDSFDAESWLNENTNYNSDCYYMVCDKAMKISHENAKAETTEHVSNDVKEFASEVRKTVKDTLENFRESEHCSFADSKLALITLIEAVQNKLDEVLK